MCQGLAHDVRVTLKCSPGTTQCSCPWTGIQSWVYTLCMSSGVHTHVVVGQHSVHMGGAQNVVLCQRPVHVKGGGGEGGA